MFGEIELPFKHVSERNMVTLKRFSGGVIYKRVSDEEEIKKRVHSSKATVSLEPVEPFNCPKMVTSHLLIELTRALVLPPKQSKSIYVKFPVEIGVLVKRSGKTKVIDVYTDNPPKYALYGDIREGSVCRYYGSDQYLKRPKAEPGTEGVINVQVKNATGTWKEISRIVFPGIAMKIYHSEKLVSAKARTRIIDDEKAETRFIDSPVNKGQRRSFKMLTAKSYNPLASGFTMEGGY